MFLGYIATLFMGFNIKKAAKDKHNKIYHKFKPHLTAMIIATFVFTLYLTYLINTYVFIANLAFVIYFLTNFRKQTRCWKQHRMISYNFFVIVLIYYYSQLMANEYINLLVLVIYLYNILEFQFAKFSFKQPLIWD